MKTRSQLFWRVLAPLVFLVALAAALVTSCARQSGEPVMFTGRTLTAADVRSLAGFAECGKLNYAQVSSAWLGWAWQDYHDWLSAGQFGPPSWSDKAQCTLFASAFEVYCQKRYFAQSWGKNAPAPGIAVGTIWYAPTLGQGHAINVVLTESGPRYFEPQTGALLTLTPEQLGSVRFNKFD